MIDKDYDLLMMESNHEGPVVTVVEAPEEMFVDEVLRNDYDYLELEPRMASPERSYVDEDQFVVRLIVEFHVVTLMIYTL